MAIGKLPRVRLGEFPTPMQPLENLSRVLGGPRLFIKRDDLSGLGLGGNKLRKLEFALADARAQGATALLTVGGVQSNHTRLTIAAGNRLGLKTFLLLRGEKPDRASGNLLIDEILGAEEIRFVPGLVQVTREKVSPAIEEAVGAWLEELRGKGERPYYIPNGCAPLHGAIGYAGCVLEMVEQLRDADCTADAVVAACGTSSTQTGLIVGAALFAHGELNVHGISVAGSAADLVHRITGQLRDAWKALDLPSPPPEDRIIVHDAFVGEGYGLPTEGMREAVRLVARAEGIVLDPVYTGKAMAGLIDLIRTGRFRSDAVVVFLHTGGAPGLFAKEHEGTFSSQS
ncbi:MAG: D-cysteine desulfhydrase family protein [Candidatus Bipolaricaulota bacterium]|nr:MAG: D-cysteine desulfhydrase family protein [Candidatus Bipolaricaulota bacterium]